MDSRFKSFLTGRLKEELEAATTIDSEDLAARIRRIGFSCLMCGKCCRRKYGDNSVIISPAEIRKICLHTGLGEDSVAQPPHEDTDICNLHILESLSELIDIQGNIHTFGQELSRKENGDCAFMQDSEKGNKCTVYGVRPMLCSTYPFYMEEGKLRISECEGLGGKIGCEESLVMARNIIDRYIEELRETIRLYEKYEDFQKGPENINKAMANIREGIINYIVHDSTGSHMTKRRLKLTDHNIKDKITD